MSSNFGVFLLLNLIARMIDSRPLSWRHMYLGYIVKKKVPTPLSDDPSDKEQKMFVEEILKRLKALLCMQTTFSNEIFSRVNGCKTKKV